MLSRKNTKRVAGFTLIEIIIASAVFSMFTVGLFAFYRMGSGMFLTGSWKLSRQKEAERFLSILKERIEQAANATSINPTNPDPKAQITTSVCNFLTLNNNTQVANIKTNRRVMIFTVAKPDMTAIDAAKRGMVAYHCLMAVPAAKKLYTLHLHANTQAAAHQGIDYFNTAANFQPNPAAFVNFATRFANNPSVFGLGRMPYTYKLGDVASATITWGRANPAAAGDETDKVVGIKIRMQNPNHPQTFVDHGIQAKLDMAVPIVPFALGGF